MDDPTAPRPAASSATTAAMFARTRGVIMAGGKSERMRASNGPLHKALVEIDGIPLIERSLRALLGSGVADVTVVTASTETAIRRYLETRGAVIAQQYGARLSSFIEATPLGNIGVVGELNDGYSDLVVMYVDNVTSIDVARLLARHRGAGAALTIASHVHVLSNPFGELEIDGGYIGAYREKPQRRVRISSGTCVVAPAAAQLIPRGKATGACELFAAVQSHNFTIAAYEHDEPWIDVNDAAALHAATIMVHAQAERFAC